MRKNRFIYILILIVLFWIMIMYNGWQTELIFKVSILVPAAAGIINLIVSRKIRIYFDDQDEYCQKEDSIKKYIMIDNKTMFPIARMELKVEVEDYFGNKETRIIVANSEPYTVRNFGMDMIFNHYGIMSVRIKKIRVYDFFFLSKFQKKMNVETVIYIFPDLENNIKFQIESCQDIIRDGESEEAFIGMGEYSREEIVEVDEYREGDDIRNIHWKLSAGWDNLIVKHYSDSKDDKIHIHVDTCVDAGHQYASCDKILGVLNSVVKFCIKNHLKYDITGYGEQGTFETDLKNVLRTIRVRKEGDMSFTRTLQERRTSGTNIYITTEDVNREIIPEDMVYINIENGKGEARNRKKYLLGDKTIIHLGLEEKEFQKKKDKCIIKPYNDKIRQRKKIRYARDNFRYVIFQSFVALMAAYLSIFSIYDVMYYGNEDFITQIGTVIIFIILHCILNIVGRNEEEKKMGRIRNLVIFAGYLLIIIFGGVSFVFDGISEVVEAFDMDIIISDTGYGFFEYTSHDLTWLMILISYAVADVIYNFCMEFVLFVHILIVVPLISISMIVGYVPSMYVVIVGLFYFPVIFVINSCIKFGRKRSRKYLSDDYPGTGNVAVSAGVITIIVTMAVFVLVMINVFWGGYNRPLWMKQSKDFVNSVIEAGSVEDGIKIISDLFKSDTVSFASERGKLDDTKKVSYTGKTVLEVMLGRGGERESFYLKSYAGTNYTGNSWDVRSSEELSEEESYLKEISSETEYTENNENYFTGTAEFSERLTYGLLSYQFMEEYYVSTSVDWYIINVTSYLKGDTNIYKPYFSLTSTQGVHGADGYEYASEEKDKRTVEFSAFNQKDILMTENVRRKYGEYPFITEYGKSDEGLQKVLEEERRYAEYVKEKYTEVPEGLESLRETFSDVTTTYQGKRVNLINGDYQYRTLGYEPYVQYVRKYFEDNGFTYNVNIVRKSGSGDFIMDFMRRKTGYCIHFASAAVMMFRSMGIPARYAEGYFVDEEDIVDNGDSGTEYEVTDESAHAWVEIYQEGFGWVPVEVTPGAENFIINYEELVKEPIQQNTMEIDNSRETDININQNTPAANQQSQTTAASQNREKREEDMGAERREELHARLRNILFILAAIALFLLRYQLINNSRVKKLENKSKNIRVREIERQLNEIFKLFGIKMEESDTNRDKAEIICNAVGDTAVDQEEVLRVLNLHDKFRYAPKGSVSREEVDDYYKFFQKYGQLMYTHGKVHEKFIYKYIKCLYLKNK